MYGDGWNAERCDSPDEHRREPAPPAMPSEFVWNNALLFSQHEYH
jgi:hypothetical protein